MPRASVAVRCRKIKIFSFPSLSYEKFNMLPRRETRIRTPRSTPHPSRASQGLPLSVPVWNTHVKQFKCTEPFTAHAHSQGQRLLPAGEHEPLALLFMEPTAGLSSAAHCMPLPAVAASGTVVSFLCPLEQRP